VSKILAETCSTSLEHSNYLVSFFFVETYRKRVDFNLQVDIGLYFFLKKIPKGKILKFLEGFFGHVMGIPRGSSTKSPE